MKVNEVKVDIPQQASCGIKNSKQSFGAKAKNIDDAFVSSKESKAPNKIKTKILKAAAAIAAFGAAILAILKSIKQKDNSSDETINVTKEAMAQKEKPVKAEDIEEPVVPVQTAEEPEAAEEAVNEPEAAEEKTEEAEEEAVESEEAEPAEATEAEAVKAEESVEPAEAAEAEKETEPAEDHFDDLMNKTFKNEEEPSKEADDTTDDRYEDISNILKAEALKYKGNQETEDENDSIETDGVEKPADEQEVTESEEDLNNKAQFAYMSAREKIQEVINAHNFAMNTGFKDVHYANGALLRTFDNGNMLEYSPDGLLLRKTNIQLNSYSIMTFDNNKYTTDIIDYSKKTGKITVQKDVKYAHGIGIPTKVYNFDRNGKLIK